MGNNLPVFSLMSQAELGAWAWKYSKASRDLAAQILPGRPRGYVRIVQDIASLASELACAKKFREDGNIKKAEEHEQNAQSIRDELPDFARPL